MLLPRVSMTTAHRLIKEPTCDWLPSSSPILCSFTFLQLSLTMLLNITLKLPVAYHILKGFKERGRLHCEYLFFFFFPNQQSFVFTSRETMFVCLKEYVEIMCDFFSFFLETVTAINTQHRKVENLKPRVPECLSRAC